MTQLPLIFTPFSKDYFYSGKRMSMPFGDRVYLPMELDTEFYQPKYIPGIGLITLNITITAQCRSVFLPDGKIYAHRDIKAIARHPVFRHECVICDYLEYLGYSIVTTREPRSDALEGYPILFLDIYTFFAVAELFRVFQGEYIEDIKYLCTHDGNQGIDQARRLRTFSRAGRQYQDWVAVPWIWTINGSSYRIALRIFDTSAVHGNANYATFCQNSGIELPYKFVFSSAEKARMLEMYPTRPEEFDNYALGDLYNHPALLGNAKNFRQIYKSLGLEEYYTLPRLTIGSTVSRIIESGIKKIFGAVLEDKNIIKRFCSYASAEHIKSMTGTTAALNAKVDGGRCRNNRPTHTFANGVLCDIDISGCYGEGLRAQLYPLGVPVIIDYPAKSNRNEYQTLRQFLKQYGKDLVPGLWQARVSTKPDYTLKYKQDFLISWLPPKDISKMKTDSEFAETDEWWTIDNTGETKIFQKEIHNAIITHDFLQWLENVATARQRKELLDNLIVITAAYYPLRNRVNSVQELLAAHSQHKGGNTTKAVRVKGNTNKISVERECHKWYAVNLGNLLVDKLLLERKKYPKKTPFNELYKVCINTVYGDMVSPFFLVGNVVVGNNITARARALAWYMEKGLFGWQSITDGCVFDVNRVAYPKEGLKITSENVVDLYTDYSGERAVTLLPLTDDELSVTPNNGQFLLREVDGQPALSVVSDGNQLDMTPDESLRWINKAAYNHLRRLFSGIDILHTPTKDVYGNERIGQFEFEAKGFYDSATFHGTANYSLRWNGTDKIAMRSYSKHPHTILVMNDVVEVADENGMPATTFLLALRNPTSVTRAKVYVKTRILKIGDYRRNHAKWKETEIVPGMNIESAALLREFSLSQFTYETLEQYQGWKTEYERLLRRYGQSYEMLFLNPDDTLNYQAMVETIDGLIRSGKRGYFDGVNKRALHTYRSHSPHDHLKCLQAVSEELNIRYLGGLPGDEGVQPDIYVGCAMD